MKHTPGPWCPVYSSMHERTVIATFDQGKDFPNAIIAIVNSTLHEIDEALSETDKANARLIAAAPELLEACKKVLDALGMLGAKGGPLDVARDVARLAISKATGGANE